MATTKVIPFFADVAAALAAVGYPATSTDIYEFIEYSTSNATITALAFTVPASAPYKIQIPVPMVNILSGGLHPGNVREAVNLVQPYAVDVASGIESAPGQKDSAKMRAFSNSLRSH